MEPRLIGHASMSSSALLLCQLGFLKCMVDFFFFIIFRLSNDLSKSIEIDLLIEKAGVYEACGKALILGALQKADLPCVF